MASEDSKGWMPTCFCFAPTQKNPFQDNYVGIDPLRWFESHKKAVRGWGIALEEKVKAPPKNQKMQFIVRLSEIESKRFSLGFCANFHHFWAAAAELSNFFLRLGSFESFTMLRKEESSIWCFGGQEVKAWPEKKAAGMMMNGFCTHNHSFSVQ